MIYLKSFDSDWSKMSLSEEVVTIGYLSSVKVESYFRIFEPKHVEVDTIAKAFHV